jgi:hypothetical protein
LNWLLATPACGGIDNNISVADSVTISIRMIWLLSTPSAFHPICAPKGATRLGE